ncbi:hypothetical protein JT55_08285 [Rhodovulum sp. NI22]|nr:hypothetical protein JT55_08285 [Rhodovulum sp. NI22]
MDLPVRTVTGAAGSSRKTSDVAAPLPICSATVASASVLSGAPASAGSARLPFSAQAMICRS